MIRGLLYSLSMRYWLMKSEPESYSIEDLRRDRKTAWEGVRNYQARNFMRDSMRVGDRVIFYHFSTKPSAAVGEGRVCSAPYADASQFDARSPYFDAKATREKPIWMLVDICYTGTFRTPVSLKHMRSDPRFKGMQLLQPGSRLSVLPLEKRHFLALLEVGGRLRL